MYQDECMFVEGWGEVRNMGSAPLFIFSLGGEHLLERFYVFVGFCIPCT